MIILMSTSKKSSTLLSRKHFRIFNLIFIHKVELFNLLNLECSTLVLLTEWVYKFPTGQLSMAITETLAWPSATGPIRNIFSSGLTRSEGCFPFHRSLTSSIWTLGAHSVGGRISKLTGKVAQDGLKRVSCQAQFTRSEMNLNLPLQQTFQWTRRDRLFSTRVLAMFTEFPTRINLFAFLPSSADCWPNLAQNSLDISSHPILLLTHSCATNFLRKNFSIF